MMVAAIAKMTDGHALPGTHQELILCLSTLGLKTDKQTAIPEKSSI
jgi:hypothetical protein